MDKVVTIFVLNISFNTRYLYQLVSIAFIVSLSKFSRLTERFYTSSFYTTSWLIREGRAVNLNWDSMELKGPPEKYTGTH